MNRFGDRRERGKWEETVPNVGLYWRSALSVLLWRGHRRPRNWVGTLLGRGEPPHLCLLHVLCINFFLIPRPQGLAPCPLPQPYSCGPTIKLSIFGVLVSYFPGTERSSERDWKQLCSQILPQFHYIPPYSLDPPALLGSPILAYHLPTTPTPISMSGESFGFQMEECGSLLPHHILHICEAFSLP